MQPAREPAPLPPPQRSGAHSCIRAHPSGKGVGLVIPTLLAWSESAVVYDIKGENWAKTAGFRQAQGHMCFKFSPVEDGNGSRFNPLSEVRIGTPARRLRRAERGRHDRANRRGQPARALLAGCRRLDHNRDDPPCLLRSRRRGQGRVPVGPGISIHEAGSELPRHARRTGELPTRPDSVTRMANAGGRTNRNTPCRARESPGDARQGRQGLFRCSFHCKDRADALQRSTRFAEHFSQRLHDQRPREP